MALPLRLTLTELSCAIFSVWDQPWRCLMEMILKVLSVLEHAAYALALLSFVGFGLPPEKGLFLAVLGLAAARWQDTLGKK